MKRFVTLPWDGEGGKLQLKLRHICLVIVAMAVVVSFSTAALAKTTYVINDGNDSIVLATFSSNAEDAISQAGIALGPSDRYATHKTGNRVHVEIHRGVTVGIVSGGVQRTVTTQARTVQEALEEQDIEFDADDRLNYELDTKLADGMVIRHVRVETRYDTEIESIPFEAEYVEDDHLFVGKTLNLIEGQEGVRTITYRCVYEDGALVSRMRSSSEVSVAPVNSLVAVGTREVPMELARMEYDYKNDMGIRVLNDYPTYEESRDDGQTVTSFSGEIYEYEDVISCIATAYTYIPGGLDITASGRPAGVGVIASDWGVIPNGTIVYVVAADGSWEYGYAIVGDNGDFGGQMVDLFMETYDQCVNFGARDCLVYIIGHGDDSYHWPE